MICVLVCLLVVWLAQYEGGSLSAYQLAHQQAKDNPNISLLPIPLPNTRLVELDGARFERLGVSFEAPWKIIVKETDRPGVTYLEFAQGRVSIVDRSAILAKFLSSRPPAIKKPIVTGLSSKSAYDRMADELRATPTQVKWWGTRRSNLRNMLLLEMKSTDVGYRRTALYSIHFGGWWGFQFGDPAVAPFGVKFELFDEHDRNLEVFLSGFARDRPTLSQAQVNAFVNSIRPLPLTSGSTSPN